MNERALRHVTQRSLAFEDTPDPPTRGIRFAAESAVVRAELVFWSVLVGTDKVKALQTCLKQALTCGMPLQPPCFGMYSVQA